MEIQNLNDFDPLKELQKVRESLKDMSTYLFSMEYDIQTKQRYLEKVIDINKRLWNYLSKLKMDIQQDIDDYNVLIDSVKKGKVPIYSLSMWSEPVVDRIPNLQSDV